MTINTNLSSRIGASLLTVLVVASYSLPLPSIAIYESAKNSSQAVATSTVADTPKPYSSLATTAEPSDVATTLIAPVAPSAISTTPAETNKDSKVEATEVKNALTNLSGIL